MNEKPSILNNGEENEMEVYGYKTIKWRKALCILGYIFSVGFLYHLFYWKPQWDVWCHCVLCSLEEANVILLRTTDEFKTYSKKKVMWIQVKLLQDMPHIEIISTETPDLSKLTTGTMYKVRCIKVKKTQYIWNPADGMFQKFGVLGDKYSCSDIHNLFGLGLSSEEQETRRKLCGPNTIDVEIMPIWKLLYKEILNPLFFFEAYTLSTWLATGYIEYSMAIIILTLLSIVASIYICRMQSVKLHHMVESHNNILVSVLHKNGVTEEVESKYLVPGDVIILTGKKFSLPCDAILISGGCILNEGMLTGESIPVTKVPLPYVDNVIPWKMHTGDNYRGHVLFCGTEVIKTKPQADGLVKAVVLQTGFNTAKGDLVRSILYPKPLNFKLHRDAFRIIMGLVALSVIGVIYTAVIYMLSGATAGEVVLMCLIMATAAVPTSLPAALSISTFYAQARLKKQGIFCISPQRINLCGQLNLICFDKTGTLTEDGLDLWGVIPSAGKCFQEVHHFNSGYTLSWSPLLGVMASCHSLVVLDETIHGDPLDLKMFEGSGWELNNRTVDWETNEIIGSCTVVNPGSTSMVPVKGICIMHQFPFSSSLQRMSVITQVLGEDTFTLYLKGAPEMVNQFCDKETVPSNFSNILDYYTQQGFRVIGLAYKNLALNDKAKIEKITREEVESDLIFLGFLIMENRLKCETKSVIQELNSANIRTVMITGDNLQTACTVGINSGIVPDAKHLVLVEANEHERDGPGSITWQFMEENIETGNNYQVPVSSSTKMLLSHNIRVNKYHYAMSGKSYQVIKKYFPRLASDMLFHGTIFARMTPKQKSSIVEDFQKLDYYVGMCGDGANDCGALKMAHAGISLSILEASVASPFTSNIPNIECVPKLLKEGRNTFVTSVSLFKYLTMYTLIGFICILLLYWKQTILGNYQYLLQDMAITITVTLTMSLNGPAPKLAPYRHSGQLFSPPLLLSLVLHFIFTIILQTSTFVLVQQQLWYNESDIFSACVRQNQGIINQTINSVPTESQNFLTTTLWHVTGINLIIVEFIFSKGRPFRQPIYTNRVFSVLIILQLGTYVFILYADIEAIYSCMELVCTPYKWRILLFLILFLFFIVSYSVEEYVIDNRRFWLVIKKMFNYKSKSRYKELQRMLEKDEDCLLFKRLDYARQYFSDLETEICA